MATDRQYPLYMERQQYPLYRNGLIIRSAGPTAYYCYICTEKKEKSWQEHIKTTRHRLTFEFFCRAFRQKGESIICERCNISLHSSNIRRHAYDHEFIPWHKPLNKFEILFSNLISARGDQYYCHLCRVKFSEWYLALSHAVDTKHQKLQKIKSDTTGIAGRGVLQYEYMVSNYIFARSPHILTCVVCHCNVERSPRYVWSHVETTSHKENTKKFIAVIKRSNDGVSSFHQPCDYNLIPHLKSANTKLFASQVTQEKSQGDTLRNFYRKNEISSSFTSAVDRNLKTMEFKSHNLITRMDACAQQRCTANEESSDEVLTTRCTATTTHKKRPVASRPVTAPTTSKDDTVRESSYMTTVSTSVPLQFDKNMKCYEEINFVYCIICQRYLLRTQESINTHSTLITHKNAVKKWFEQAQPLLASCFNYLNDPDLCYYFKLNVPSNQEILVLREVFRKNPTQENIIYWCSICNFKTYSSFQVKKHWKHNRPPKVLEDLPEFVENLLRRAEETVASMVEIMDKGKIDNEHSEDILLQDLANLAAKKYPDVVAFAFGSRVCGLANKTSDLDIFLDCDIGGCPTYFGENCTDDEIRARLQIIEGCLKNDAKTWRIEKSIPLCNVPIIKVIHKPTSINSDISFTNGLGVEKTLLIKSYCEKYVNCRKLIMFLKKWTSDCKLGGLDGISSYAIAWFVIFFLQTESILPTVSELIKKENKSRHISGWEVGVSEDFEASSCGGNFKMLLIHFFKFYAAFNFKRNVICPLLGTTIEKVKFRTPNNLPSEMESYKQYIKEPRKPKQLHASRAMCLQDPLELVSNMTKLVKKDKVDQFKKFCADSANVLSC